MPLSIMVKPASSACNLRCEYCFYTAVAKKREVFDKGMLSLETSEKMIFSAFECSKDFVGFVFQGGEPLIRGIDFYREFVSLVKKYNTSGAEVSFAVQTNGTLLNDEWCEFFRENNFLVGVSLDGNEEQNKYRVYPDGSASFGDIMGGIELLKKHNVQFNVLSVLTKNLANTFRDSYKFFKSMGFSYLQYIPCLRDFDSDDDVYVMNNEDYLNYLNSAFRMYYNARLRGTPFSIRQFDNFVLLAHGSCPEQCGMKGGCSEQFVVEGDGSVYPCDFYCNDEQCLGNINDTSFAQMRKNKKALDFISSSFEKKDECNECKYYYLCRGGGCKRNNASFNYCETYKKFFSQNEGKILSL